MPIPAVVTFSGFPGAGDCHLALADEGYPAAVATAFASARRASCRPAAFPGRFFSLQASSRLAAPQDHHGAAAEGALYHYRVRLVARRRTPLIVDCWRRYPGGIGWQRRCGPMPLERFMERFAAPAGSA